MSVTAPEDAALQERVGELERSLDLQRARLQAMHQIGAALGSTLNLDRLLELIMTKTTELMAADRSTLYLIDDDTAELWSKIAQGESAREIRFPIGQGVAGWVAKTGQTLNIKDAYKDSRFNQEWDRKTGYRTRSMLCLPMRNHRRKIIGVIQVLNKATGYFTLDDEQLLAALTSQAAISIENSKLYLSVVGKNIELLDTQEKLRLRVEEMDLLFRIEQEMNRHHELDSLLMTLLSQACRGVASEAATMHLKGTSGWRLFALRPDRGDGLRILESIPQDQGGKAAEVAESDEPYVATRLADSEAHDPVLCARLGLTIRTAAIVPLTIGGESLGALQLLNRKGTPNAEFSGGDVKLLTVIAGRAEAAIVLARQRDEEKKASRLAAIGQALSGVLHDLKTPMTVISGYSQLMVDEEETDERKYYAEAITRQLDSLKGMTTEILSFARGESNLLIRKVFVHQFLHGVKEVLDQEFKASGVDLVLDLHYRDAIRMDQRRVERAIFNLARNARQAMVDGGTFVIRSLYDAEENVVQLDFVDNGPGIPERIRHNLFEEFVTSGKKDGTGLGLAIVKKIVEQHQGTITFETDEGVGTTFHLRLPRNVPKGK